jgi:hypothetical protein
MGTSDGRVVGTTKFVDHGLPQDLLNVVVVAEGYRQAELGSFANHAQAFANRLFATAPFAQVQWAINVYRIDVESTDSGADDPATCSDGSTGSGATPRTYFDATFCTSGVRRLLTVNNGTVLNVVGQQVPQWHVILVIVNTTGWGGAGGSVGTTSLAPGWENIAIHELGHTLFGLADEYEYYLGCGSGETDRNSYPSPFEPWEPNISKTSDRAAIRWRDLIAAATPMPTTSNPDCTRCDPQGSPVATGTVGAFEGAGYYHCGLFRPEFSCMMRTTGAPFCAVCRRQILTKLAPYIGNINWDSLNGELFDGDVINVTIQENAVDPATVEFVLEAADNVRWWKGINVPDGEGSSWEIWTQDDTKSGRVSLWAHQVHHGQKLEFRKAKALGVHTGMYRLGDLGRLNPGARVTFRWVQDEHPNKNASFVSQAVPQPMTAGQRYLARVTMRNTGSREWTSDARYRLGAQNPQDNSVWGLSRVELPGTTPPNQEASFRFYVTAPAAPGVYQFQWQMLQEWIAWFGAASPSLSLQVVAKGKEKDKEKEEKEEKEEKDKEGRKEAMKDWDDIPAGESPPAPPEPPGQVGTEASQGAPFIRPEERPPVGEWRPGG